MHWINWEIKGKINGIIELFYVAIFYLTGIIPTRMTTKQYSRVAHYFLNHGDPNRAIKLFIAASSREPRNINLMHQLGATYFILGDYITSEKIFTLAAYARSSLRKQYYKDYAEEVCLLDNSWLLAIGHIACISTLIKAKLLGYFPNRKLIISVDEINPPVGLELLQYFGNHVEIIREVASLENTNRFMFGIGSVLTDHQTHIRRIAASQDFWSGSLSSDGKSTVRWFAPFNAAIESEWSNSGHSSDLFQITDSDRIEFRDFMYNTFGLDRDAWFVALHVREPGFHIGWGKYHQSTRDANIKSYESVISYINSSGGVIVRMGDSSMTPAKSQPGLIDYAHSNYKNEKVDIMLCSQCKYFIGTNSGLSLVPPIFGVKSLLTNWSPIAIPNWFSDDIYIPKLIFDKRLGRYLTFNEMFSSRAGWSQFTRDFRGTDWRVEDNSEEDLLEAVEEMHNEIFSQVNSYTSIELERFNKFKSIVLSNGGYVGSRIGRKFLEKYEYLL